MDERPELYELESIEQLRAVADPLRLRIVDLIADRPATATQIGEALGVPANKIHYHVRELERVGIVTIVETREKGGILEKYYQTVAHTLSAPRTMLRQSSDESVAAVTEILQSVVHNFLLAFSHTVRTHDWDATSINMHVAELYMTNDELVDVTNKIMDLLKPYDHPGRGEGTSPISLLLLSHPQIHGGVAPDEAVVDIELGPTVGGRPAPAGSLSSAGSAGAAPQPAPQQGKIHRVIAIGSLSYSKRDLEALADKGERLDLNVLGLLSFGRGITPDLIERTVVRCRHRGALNASSEVKAVLKRKGSATRA